MSRRTFLGILAAIVVLGAGLRLFALGEAPPGIHVDAAANRFNARCLAAEGRDATGASWPLLYTRGFGENRSTLFLYVSLPFAAAWGGDPGTAEATIALPCAIAGILAVVVVAWIATALFGRAAGLVAAFVVATAPWALMLARTGHEAGLVPLLVAASVAAMLWAGLPLAGDRPAGTARGVVAGIVCGVACYGYPAVRLFLPAFAALSVAFAPKRWLAFARTARGRSTLAGFALAAIAIAGPLYAAHVTDPAINRRAESLLVWDAGDGIATAASKVIARYALHFTPGFLFVEGDTYFWNAIPDVPPLRPWTAPLLLLGIGASIATARGSAASRTALALLAAYPAGDVLTRHVSVHALRASPGIVAVAVLAGFGASFVGRSIARRGHRLAVGAAAVALAAVAIRDVPVLRTYFVEMPRRDDVRSAYNVDLLDAFRRIGPETRRASAVFITTHNPGAVVNTWVVAAVGLGVAPDRWFSEERRFADVSGLDVCTRFGNVRFMADDSWRADYRELAANGRPDRMLFVLRPYEPAPGPVSDVIRDASGEPALLIYDVTR